MTCIRVQDYILHNSGTQNDVLRKHYFQIPLIFNELEK